MIRKRYENDYWVNSIGNITGAVIGSFIKYSEAQLALWADFDHNPVYVDEVGDNDGLNGGLLK